MHVFIIILRRNVCNLASYFPFTISINCITKTNVVYSERNKSRLAKIFVKKQKKTDAHKMKLNHNVHVLCRKLDWK